MVYELVPEHVWKKDQEDSRKVMDDVFGKVLSADFDEYRDQHVQIVPKLHQVESYSFCPLKYQAE